MPYGPHLALATVFLFLCRPLVVEVWSILIPTVSCRNRLS